MIGVGISPARLCGKAMGDGALSLPDSVVYTAALDSSQAAGARYDYSDWTVVADDLILFGISGDTGLAGAGIPSGYTPFEDDDDSSPSTLGGFKVLVGDETGEIAFEPTNPENGERVSGVLVVLRGFTTPTNYARAEVNGGMPNPPSLGSISGTSLVLAWGFLDDDFPTDVTAPDGFVMCGVGYSYNFPTAGNASTTMLALKEGPDSTEDPDAFGGSGNDVVAAVTMEVPAA